MLNSGNLHDEIESRTDIYSVPTPEDHLHLEIDISSSNSRQLGLKIGLMTFGGIVFNIGHYLGVPLKLFLTNSKVKIIVGWKTTADCEILEVTGLHKTKTSGD